MPPKALTTFRPISSLLLGLAGTLAVAVAHVAGVDERAELQSLDLRFRHCSRAEAPPNILHVDIDDRSLTELGRWPWPRKLLAGIVRELQDCGAQAIVLDIIFPEPQEVRYVSVANEIYGTGRTDLPGGDAPVPVFDDAALAEAIDREPDVSPAVPLTASTLAVWRASQAAGVLAGAPPHFVAPGEGGDRQPDVFLAMFIDFDESEKPRQGDPLIEAVRRDLTASPAALAERLDRPLEQIKPHINDARQAVIDERVGEILSRDPQAPFARVLDFVLGASTPNRTGELTDRTQKSYLRRRAVQSVSRFAVPPERVSDFQLRCGKLHPPLVLFAQRTALTGFVTFQPDTDGVTRRIHLLARGDGMIYPQFAFAAARHELARRHGGTCTLSARGSRVVLQCADGTRREVPVGPDGTMLIHWARGTWGRDRANHIPAAAVANVCRQRRTLRQRRELAHVYRMKFLSLGRGLPEGHDDLRQDYNAFLTAGETFNAAYMERIAAERAIYRDRLYRPDRRHDPRLLWALRRQEQRLEGRRWELAEKLVAQLRTPANLQAFLAKPVEPRPATQPAELAGQRRRYRQELERYEQAERTARQTLTALDAMPQQMRRIEDKLKDMTQEMRKRVSGRICMVGSTATGAADFVPTPLDPRTPGVVVHSNTIHTVLSGSFIRAADTMTNAMVILAMGVLVSLLGATRPALQTATLAALLAAGYVAVNAMVVFRLGNLWLAMVAPVAAMFMSFLFITVYRQLTEERAKRRIRDLFAHALSPALVDRLLEDPSLLELGGQKRSVSCIFADLAGFTALSERLGPQDTVRMLNRYFDRITEVVQSRRGGYLNKFLGDGVFCFFGAPVFQEDHSRRAVQAAVDCQDEVDKLNQTISRELGVPALLSVRIGVTTGEAMVGNCGSTQRMDYTAIGDCVNLASRLEAANKTFGTRILAAEEAWRRGADGDLLGRPLGGVVIAGFSEAVRVWEILGRAGPDAGSGQETREALADFARAIERFEKSDFGGAAAILERVLRVLGDDGPTRIYLGLCRQGLAGAPAEELRLEYKKPEDTLRVARQSSARRAERPPN